MPSKARVIYWFRTDLRLHDSPALKAALDLQPECLWPIWCWDPHYVYRARVGSNRWQFLLDCQSDLSASITKVNRKSKLFVIREAPQTLLPKLFKAWKVTHLVFEKDTDAYARDRDHEVMKLAKGAGVEVVVRTGRTLYDSDELVEKNNNQPTMSITQVEKAAEKIGPVARPIPAPATLPDPGLTPLDFSPNPPTPDPDLNSVQRSSNDRSYFSVAGPNNDFAVPTMSEMGLKPATSPHRGGETLAIAALTTIIENEIYTATFEKPLTAPTAFSPQSTTLLSPHMHFGSLSCREFYWRVQDVITAFEKARKKVSHPPVSLTGQLLFRDMYFAAQAKLGWSFGQTEGNSHCRFIPWHLRNKLGPNGLSTGEYSIDDPQAEDWFQRWKFGRTGFPWIDAVMRQLKTEGWIHHLARHAVACFLTRGGCYVAWERGAEVFEEWLIDHEAACNIGNWQWLSCTAFYAQFHRCYSPIAFPQKTDKEGVFVRHFVPELKDFPTKYIYEPWKAPVADQKKAGCLIKGDGREEIVDGMKRYPKPMFDFAQRRAICIEGMKKAYQVKLYGNDPKVLDGTWRELFSDDAEGATEGKNDIEATVAGMTGAGKRIQGNVDLENADMGVDESNDEAADRGGDLREGNRSSKRRDGGGGKRKRGTSNGTLDAFVTADRSKKRR